MNLDDGCDEEWWFGRKHWLEKAVTSRYTSTVEAVDKFLL